MIKILKAIYSILSNDNNVISVVSDKIFPDIVPDKDTTNENIDYPLIIMTRATVDPTNSKCKNSNSDKATIEIICYSNSYNDAVDLAQYVRTALDFYKGTVESIRIDNIRLISMNEDYLENVYYQQLIFR